MNAIQTYYRLFGRSSIGSAYEEEGRTSKLPIGRIGGTALHRDGNFWENYLGRKHSVGAIEKRVGLSVSTICSGEL